MGELESIEDVLRAHEYLLQYRSGGICACGFVPEVDASTLQTQQDYHRAHLADAIRAHLAEVAGRPEVRQKTVIAVMDNAIGDPAKGEPFHVREISTDHAIADAVAAVGAYLQAIGDQP